MNQDIALKETEMAARYYQSERHTIQVDWLPYMDELAREVGAFPPVWRYLFTDPKLFWALMFGPASPYQYRLVGPNAWSGAREAMLTVQQRIDCPLHTNHQQGNAKSLQKASKVEKKFHFFSIGLIFIAFVIYFAYQSILNIFKTV